MKGERATCKRCTDVVIIIKSSSNSWARRDFWNSKRKITIPILKFLTSRRRIGSSESERRKWRGDDSTHRLLRWDFSAQFIHCQISNWTYRRLVCLSCDSYRWLDEKKANANEVLTSGVDLDATGGFPKVSISQNRSINSAKKCRVTDSVEPANSTSVIDFHWNSQRSSTKRSSLAVSWFRLSFFIENSRCAALINSAVALTAKIKKSRPNCSPTFCNVIRFALRSVNENSDENMIAPFKKAQRDSRRFVMDRVADRLARFLALIPDSQPHWLSDEQLRNRSLLLTACSTHLVDCFGFWAFLLVYLYRTICNSGESGVLWVDLSSLVTLYTRTSSKHLEFQDSRSDVDGEARRDLTSLAIPPKCWFLCHWRFHKKR